MDGTRGLRNSCMGKLAPLISIVSINSGRLPVILIGEFNNGITKRGMDRRPAMSARQR